ncbi:MAG: tetratricopeptide repeat protein [Rubrivivax sp.]|nr:tetratricopeptide repeat protein [Rubrivivax sp.]
MKTLNRAEELFRLEDFKDALVEFQKIIDKDPNDAVANQRIAECYYRLGDYNSAMEAANKAIEINPRLAVPHIILAFIYSRNDRYDQSIAEALVAYNLSPELVDSLDCYGTILTAQGRLKEGIPLLEKARDLEPTRLSVRNNLSIAYRGLRNYNKYLQEAEFVFKRSPSIKNGFRLLVAYQHKYALPLSMLVIFATLGALIFRMKLLLIIPAYIVVRGLLISYQLLKERKLKAALTHFTAYMLFAIFLGAIYSLI